MKLISIQPLYIESIPSELEEGVLYISKKYRTTSHLCPCGCGERIALPIKPGGWRLATNSDGLVSLSPSVGNFSVECNSHYFITDNRIEWAREWSEEEIQQGRQADLEVRVNHYEQNPSNTIWGRILDWFRQVCKL